MIGNNNTISVNTSCYESIEEVVAPDRGRVPDTIIDMESIEEVAAPDRGRVPYGEH